MSEEQQVFEALPSEDDNSQEFQATVVTNEPTEAEPEELDASAEEESGKGKDPWYKRRIDELTRDKHEARRQAERLEKILEQQEAMLKRIAPQTASQADTLAPPTPEDYVGGQFAKRCSVILGNGTCDKLFS